MIEPDYKVFDDRFKIEHLDNYDLTIELSLTRFKFLIKNSTSNQIEWLEDYFLGLNNDIEAARDKIEEIITEHKFLSANYWNTLRILSSSPFYCLVPTEFYEPNHESQLLKLQFPRLNSELHTYFNAEIIKSNGMFIYAIHNTLIETIKKLYPQKEFEIGSSIVNTINFYLSEANTSNQNLLLVDDNSLLLIYLTKSTKNLMAEKLPLYSIKIKEFLLYNLKELNLRTIAYGEITNFSPVYKKIKTIIKTLELGKLPQGTNISQYFSEVPEHRYLNLII